MALLFDEGNVLVVDVLSFRALTFGAFTVVAETARSSSFDACSVSAFGDFGEASESTTTHGRGEVGIGTHGFQGTFLDVFFDIETHPGEPDGFDVFVEGFSELFGDFGRVRSEKVVDLGDAAGSEQGGGEGTRAHRETTEEDFGGGRARHVDGSAFVHVATTDVGAEQFDAGRGDVKFFGNGELFEFFEVGVTFEIRVREVVAF